MPEGVAGTVAIDAVEAAVLFDGGHEVRAEMFVRPCDFEVVVRLDGEQRAARGDRREGDERDLLSEGERSWLLSARSRHGLATHCGRVLVQHADSCSSVGKGSRYLADTRSTQPCTHVFERPDCSNPFLLSCCFAARRRHCHRSDRNATNRIGRASD